MDSVESVTFSPDGRRIASTGWDGKVKLWDSATGLEAIGLNGDPEELTSTAFSPDGCASPRALQTARSRSGRCPPCINEFNVCLHPLLRVSQMTILKREAQRYLFVM